MGVHRSEIRRRDQSDAVETKIRNRRRKTKEVARRDARMADMIKAGSLPYTPVVMSWLSRQLGKASTGITEEDVRSLST